MDLKVFFAQYSSAKPSACQDKFEKPFHTFFVLLAQSPLEFYEHSLKLAQGYLHAIQ